MPTYDYYCETCGKEFEHFQSMKAEALTTCTCGKEGKVQRRIGGGSGLIFKGSGFYITDYKKSSGASSSSSSSTGSGSSSATPSSS